MSLVADDENIEWYFFSAVNVQYYFLFEYFFY